MGELDKDIDYVVTNDNGGNIIGVLKSGDNQIDRLKTMLGEEFCGTCEKLELEVMGAEFFTGECEVGDGEYTINIRQTWIY